MHLLGTVAPVEQQQAHKLNTFYRSQKNGY